MLGWNDCTNIADDCTNIAVDSNLDCDVNIGSNFDLAIVTACKCWVWQQAIFLD